MKLATYKDGSRDGQLVVVSRDLTMAHYATEAAHTLQQVLDDWNFISPQLQDLYTELNHGKGRHVFAFDPSMCLAPLPRAFQCVSGLACGSHLDVLREAAGLTHHHVQPSGQARVAMTQVVSDCLRGAVAPLYLPKLGGQLDFESGLAVITGDVPAGCSPSRALDAVRLLTLLCSPVQRDSQSPEFEGGMSSAPSHLGAAFSPVAITPDELGAAWVQGRLNASLQTTWNGQTLGAGDVGPDMTLHLGQLVAQAASTRRLGAGTVVGTGPISHADVDVNGVRQWPKGWHCLLEKRAAEVLQTGQPVTRYLNPGDTWAVDLIAPGGQSVMGRIEQQVLESLDG